MYVNFFSGVLMNKIAEQARLKESLEELARFGCPVDLSVADAEPENEKVEIDQAGWFYGSRLFELPDGRVAFMADIAVTNLTSRTIHIIDVELRPSWDGSNFQWLTPVKVTFQTRTKRRRWRSHSHICDLYQFPGTKLEFGYEQVLNHRLLERRKLVSQHPLEGWLLAIGGRIPAELRHGQGQDMTLTLIGADHAEYSATIQLCTERLLVPRKSVEPRTSIFGESLKEMAMGLGEASTAENNRESHLQYGQPELAEGGRPEQILQPSGPAASAMQEAGIAEEAG
jgi:hypothetical protein